MPSLPCPFPLIAYACVGVSEVYYCFYKWLTFHSKLCYGLEEYITGKHIQKNFTEAEYADYYKKLVRNLKKMSRSVSHGRYFEEIISFILEYGWCVEVVLDDNVH